MEQRKQTRKMRKSILRRSRRDEVYDNKRNDFEVEEIYSGWLWWAKPQGWVVNVLRVEGAVCSAIMGSLGTVVPHRISDILPSKFAAYRWIVENVVDLDDANYYMWEYND